MNILHIDSAITGDASVSRQLTAQIVARLKAANPAASVTYRDLNEGVPAIDTDWFKAVRLVPETRPPNSRRWSPPRTPICARCRMPTFW